MGDGIAKTQVMIGKELPEISKYFQNIILFERSDYFNGSPGKNN